MRFPVTVMTFKADVTAVMNKQINQIDLCFVSRGTRTAIRTDGQF